MSNLIRRPRRTVENPLITWVKQATNDAEKGTCTMMSLVRVVGEGTYDEVYTTRFAGPKWSGEELAEMFFNKAKEDCKDDRGVEHKYSMLAFYSGKDQPEATKRFSLNPFGEEVEYLNESPDHKGSHAQGMRHTETLFQGTVRLLSQTVSQMAIDTKELRQENREMRQQTWDMMTKLLELHNDHEMKLAEFQRNSEERKLWMGFAPALINNLLGKEIFPQSTADTALINTIAEGITEEDIKKLAQSSDGLPPHVWGPLAMRILDHRKKTKEAKEAVPKTLRLITNTRNPEDDAAGD